MQNLHLCLDENLPSIKKCPIFFQIRSCYYTQKDPPVNQKSRRFRTTEELYVYYFRIYPSKNLKNSDQPTRNIHNHLFTRHKQMPKTQDISTLLILALNEINQLFGSPGMAKPLLLVLHSIFAFCFDVAKWISKSTF